MPLIATRGAASAQGFGEFAQTAAPTYIEDVFSTYLYTGTSATQTITNNIDLSTKGGMVWIKARDNVTSHELYDTSRGVSKRIFSDATTQQLTNGDLNGFTSSGFSLGYVSGGANGSGTNYASWTFRKQAKFFDVVTYTGTGSAQNISHNLGSVPGCIIIKKTDAVSNWAVYHRSLGANAYLALNDTAGSGTSATWWNSTTPTSTVFTVGTSFNTNASGGTYVAYIFAHDAGGYGASGSENVITCGSVTSSGGVLPSVNLGYEPQWLLLKGTGGAGFGWTIQDNMRGSTYNGGVQYLRANTTGAENADTGQYGFTSTGLNGVGTAGFGNELFIYIAIRRGPMKTPTVGTSVYFATNTQDVNTSITPGFPVDLAIDRYRFQDNVNANQVGTSWVYDRLRGTNSILQTSSTAAEVTAASGPSFYVSTTGFQSNTKLNIGPGDGSLGNDNAQFWTFKRAPGFFDEVCYTGTGTTGQVVNHNLGVTPEMVIIKRRDGIINWFVYQTGLSYGNSIYLNLTSAQSNDGGPAFALTSTTITFDRTYVSNLNTSTGTYVAYLFATCPGVSKVGSYTGTAALLTVNCGFTTGARFVLIKRTDTTGDWYVYDSSRGITSGNDPYLFWNSTAAQNSTTNYVDTDTTGFKVTAAAPVGLNASGGTYIFLAIA